MSKFKNFQVSKTILLIQTQNSLFFAVMLAIKYLYFAYKAQRYVLLPHTRENLVKGASVPFSNHLWLQSLLSLGPHYEAVIKCLRHLLWCTFIFKIQFTQVFCTKQKVIKIQCFLLHKEHEIISILSILILLFPSCHSFLLEKNKTKYCGTMSKIHG